MIKKRSWNHWTIARGIAGLAAADAHWRYYVRERKLLRAGRIPQLGMIQAKLLGAFALAF